MDKKTTILAYCFNLLIGLPHFGRGKREGGGGATTQTYL